MSVDVARFEAPTMNEALAKIRAVFGDDGMIVGTRTFRRGGLLGVGGQEMVEVFVADTRSRSRSLREQAVGRWRRPAALAPGGTTGREEVPTGVADTDGYELLSRRLTEMREEVRELLARSLEYGGFTQPFLKDCYEYLLSNDVEPRFADGLVREIANLPAPPVAPDRSRMITMMRAQLAKLLVSVPPAEPVDPPRLVVLIGPTGVGKTTTVAKLAARAKINEGRKVGLITLDTFRIGAVDQLEKYAGIIDVPLKVASDPDELEAAIGEARAQGLDLVFIDTAGRSQRDEVKMEELKEFVARVPEAEVHLVLSGGVHARTFESVVERFSEQGFDRIILTKIDESASLGALAASIARAGKAVSYVTDGQNVPDDIMTCDTDRLAGLMLKARLV